MTEILAQLCSRCGLGARGHMHPNMKIFSIVSCRGRMHHIIHHCALNCWKQQGCAGAGILPLDTSSPLVACSNSLHSKIQPVENYACNSLSARDHLKANSSCMDWISPQGPHASTMPIPPRLSVQTCTSFSVEGNCNVSFCVCSRDSGLPERIIPDLMLTQCRGLCSNIEQALYHWKQLLIWMQIHDLAGTAQEHFCRQRQSSWDTEASMNTTSWLIKRQRNHPLCCLCICSYLCIHKGSVFRYQSLSQYTSQEVTCWISADAQHSRFLWHCPPACLQSVMKLLCALPSAQEHQQLPPFWLPACLQHCCTCKKSNT